MKRTLYFILLLTALVSCTNKAEQPADVKLNLEYVGGSRARFSVAVSNMDAIYTFLNMGEHSDNFHQPDDVAARHEIARMEESYEEAKALMTDNKWSNFTDFFFFRGSRQFTMNSLTPDTDFRFVIFQIHPKTHQLIGEPLSIDYHTKPVAERDLNFDLSFDGDVLTIVPSDDHLTYFWDYENEDIVKETYFFPNNFTYSLVGMYQEYGFLDSELSKGTDTWDFTAQDNTLNEGERCILVIAGCEDGEFTTDVKALLFRYQKGNIEVLDWDYYIY